MNYYQKNCDGIMHTVKKGDTLYRLSRMYSVSVDDIMDANPDVNVYNLQIGSSVCIPMTIPAVPLMPDREPMPVAPCPGCAKRLPQPDGKGAPMPAEDQGASNARPQPSMDVTDGQISGEDFTATQAMKDEMPEDSDQFSTEYVYPGMSLINRENTWNEDAGNDSWGLSDYLDDDQTFASPFNWEQNMRPDGPGWQPGGPGMPPNGPGMWPGGPGMPPGGPGGPGMPPGGPGGPGMPPGGPGGPGMPPGGPGGPGMPPGGPGMPPNGPGMPPDWIVIQPHRVVRGETINSILVDFNMDFETFARLNPQIMPIPLMPGDTIFVKGNRPQPREDN